MGEYSERENRNKKENKITLKSIQKKKLENK